jgi:hypothetical protein
VKPSDVNQPAAYATLPTPFTRFLRTFIPYQLFRFAALNFRMIRLVVSSHSPKLRNARPKPDKI